MPEPASTRRAWLGSIALPWLSGLAGCATPLPIVPAPAGEDAAATARWRDSALAHGLAAYRGLTDISVAYEGEWRPLVGRIQPELVDAGFRGGSQERLLPHLGVVAQAHRGAQGRKQVCWQRGGARGDQAASSAAPVPGGDIAVWFNGAPCAEPAALDTAALVAEAYGLFLLGPLWLADRGNPPAMRLAGTERVDGRACDVLDVWLSPGLGRVALDRVSLCIDHADSVMRRVRFTLDGFAGTRGAVAEVDTFDHQRRFGVLWPMRSFERVVHPIALPAHDWHLAGLDVNRGYGVEDVTGPAFSGRAAPPAAPT